MSVAPWWSARPLVAGARRGAGLAAVWLAAWQPAPLSAQGDIQSSLAARTSLVLQAKVNTLITGTHDGTKLFVNAGAQVDWIPRRPFIVTLGLHRTVAGDAKQHTIEAGAGWRLRDVLGTGDVAIMLDGRVVGDSVYTRHRVGERVAHRFVTLRAGILTTDAPSNAGQAQPNAANSTAAYLGIAGNALLNETEGQLGFRIVRTTAIDLLYGSVDSLTLTQRKLGFRAYLTRDVGSVIGWRWEVGIKPGFGFYTFLSADFYYMIQDVLR